ncbi:MAG: hypothetical protein VCA55_04570 [Verrucomicrobiales bacterium]
MFYLYFFMVQVGVTAHKHPMHCTGDGDYSLPAGAGRVIKGMVSG